MTGPAPDAAEAGGDFGRLALALAVLSGAVLRLWDLSSASLHSDEAFTFALSSLPILALLHNVVVHDFHPPLFYLATHYLMVWLPKPPWDYRYVTALFGVVTILATWGAARRMFGPTAAAFAALAVALQPALVQHDRLYRMYAVTVGLSTLAWWLLLEAERAQRRRRIWLFASYALAAIALPYVDYLGAFMLACQGLYVLTRLPALAPALGALLLAALAYVPWIGALRQQVPLGGFALSNPSLDLGLAASIKGAFAAGVPDAWLAWPGGVVVPAIAISAVVLMGSLLGRRSALPFWLGALALQVAGSIILGKNLAYFPRYLLIDVPPVCIALGLVVSALAATRLRLAAAALALACLTLFAVETSNVLFVRYYQFPDWYALNALMLPSERPGDAIVLDAGYELLVVSEYTAFRGREVLSFMNPRDFNPILSWIARHPRRRVWYVQAQNFYWDPQQRIAVDLRRTRAVRLSRCWPRQSPVDDVCVMLFDEVPMRKIR